MPKELTKNSVLVWAAVMLCINISLPAVILAALVMRGESLAAAFEATGPGQLYRLFEPSAWADSWWPMLLAYQWRVANPENQLYDVFFDQLVKFQYPAVSLLFWDLFPSSMLEPLGGEREIPGRLKQVLTWLSQTAVLVTVLASALIVKIGCDRIRLDQPIPSFHKGALIGLVLVLGSAYYPLFYGHVSGQIQVVLNALGALAVLSYLLGYQTLAGALFGACTLVKPQYGLILVWSLLRKRHWFALGFSGTFLTGLAIGILRFGLEDNLQYLQVVQFLSRHGESYYLNQSVNGLLNRLLENGSPHATSSPGGWLGGSQFPPYHPVVYWSTLITSAGFLAAALWPLRPGRRERHDAIDLVTVIVAATIASPIAWNHHYGIFLPVLAVALPLLIQNKPLGDMTAPFFALSWAAMANVLPYPWWFFINPWRGLAASHLFLGGLMLFGLLLLVRRKLTN